MSLYLAGEKEEWLEWIGRAAASSDQLPDRDQRLLGILRAYYEERDVELAERHVELFTKAYPKDQEANFWRAQAEADLQGNPVRAIRVLREVLHEEPDHLPAVLAMSNYLAELGGADDVARFLADYRARFPDATGLDRHDKARPNH
jgi:tetratricopeptide (TPR) repeat protein